MILSRTGRQFLVQNGATDPFSNLKNDKNEHSKNHEEVKKSPCYNWIQAHELSNDCENFEHSLSVNIDSDECDVSVDSNTTYVDSLECNMKD